MLKSYAARFSDSPARVGNCRADDPDSTEIIEIASHRRFVLGSTVWVRETLIKSSDIHNVIV
jgi:hypothetical protein